MDKRYEAREIPERKVELSDGYLLIAKTWKIWDNEKNDFMKTAGNSKVDWTNGPSIAKRTAEMGNEIEAKKN